MCRAVVVVVFFVVAVFCDFLTKKKLGKQL